MRPPGAFRDPTPLLRWTGGLLILLTVVAFVALGLRLRELYLLEQVAGGALSGQPMIEAGGSSDAMVEAVAGLRALVFLASTIPFGMWIYRANRNARALGAGDMKYSAGWAVGCYFVPILNLFAPLGAMREIWRASLAPAHWRTAPGTPLLGWWWGLWLANAIVGAIGTALLRDAHDIASAELASAVAAAQNLVMIALNAVALQLLRRITANQLAQCRPG